MTQETNGDGDDIILFVEGNELRKFLMVLRSTSNVSLGFLFFEIMVIFFYGVYKIMYDVYK